jgi:hypothetical protein
MIVREETMAYRPLTLVCSILLLALSGCSPEVQSTSDSGTPGRRFHLNEDQIRADETLAEAGDKAAVTRLTNHYMAAASDIDRATVWMRRGAALGDHYSMLNLAYRIAGKGGEANCKETEALLTRILESSPTDAVKADALGFLLSLRTDTSWEGKCYQWLKK